MTRRRPNPTPVAQTQRTPEPSEAADAAESPQPPSVAEEEAVSAEAALTEGEGTEHADALEADEPPAVRDGDVVQAPDASDEEVAEEREADEPAAVRDEDVVAAPETSVEDSELDEPAAVQDDADLEAADGAAVAPEDTPGSGDGESREAEGSIDQPAEPAPPVETDAQPARAPHGNMPESTRHAWRRFGRLLGPRVNAGNLLAALMTLAVGFALVAQVQAAQDVGLQDLSESDLVALLDDVTERADSLEEEIRLLEADKRTLQQGSGADAAEAAEARLASHQILAGTVPVEGPGITMSVSVPRGGFTPTMMIDVMQELRNAGAEAIQIGQVRVVATSWIGIVDGELTVDGQIVETPFRVVAIGDPHTLSGAMAIPGGFTDSVRGVGGDVQVVEGESLVVDALHPTAEPQYARPVSSE
ncbi:MAG TPA: DUF881 domain-containing protein [Ornithinicoccus sp.]|nr:DUF881 domain-containing protein [Ornithinicoccus sp.]